MSLKRKVLGAGLFGVSSLPVSQAIANSTMPAYQQNQRPKFVRRGKVVDNPFYKKRKKRENIIKALGAVTSGYVGAKSIPKGLKTLSKSLGEREYGLAMKNIDEALDEITKARNRSIKNARNNPMFFKKYEKQFVETQQAAAKLRDLKKNLTKEKFIDYRDSQTLPFRGVGTSKKMRDILGIKGTALSDTFRRRSMDGREMGQSFGQRIRSIK